MPLFLFSLLISFHIPSPTYAQGRLGPHGLHGDKLANPNHWMAVIGDSGVTGAASASTLEPTLANLLSHMYKFITQSRVQTSLPRLEEFPMPELFHLDNIAPLTRVPYSKREFEAAGSKLLLNLGAKLSLALDTHEHAFPYLVGRALGIQPQDIVLVGQDGVRVETIAAQIERIFEMRTQSLPPLVLLSYTANDLCDAEVFREPIESRAAQFKTALDKTWQQAAPRLKAFPGGTKIVVLAPFDVVNVITNPEVLAQKVTVQGQGETTCGDLRGESFSLDLSAWLIRRMLNLMCPSVTSTHPGDTEKLARLHAVQLAFGEMWKKKIEELNAQYTDIHWAYLESVRDVHFTTGDVGNDCFHPSVRGHAKIAMAILASGLLDPGPNPGH